MLQCHMQLEITSANRDANFFFLCEKKTKCLFCVIQLFVLHNSHCVLPNSDSVLHNSDNFSIIQAVCEVLPTFQLGCTFLLALFLRVNFPNLY